MGRRLGRRVSIQKGSVGSSDLLNGLRCWNCFGRGSRKRLESSLELLTSKRSTLCQRDEICGRVSRRNAATSFINLSPHYAQLFPLKQVCENLRPDRMVDMAITKSIKRDSLRIPPQHIESEMALLGAIMLRPDVVHDIADLVFPESFYAEKHRMIFTGMLELFSKNEPIDLLSLSTKLENKNTLQAIGGKSYLTELVQSVPSTANAIYYAELVKNKYLLRRLIEAAEKISEMGYGSTEGIEEIIDKAEKEVFEISTSGSSKKFTDSYQ